MMLSNEGVVIILVDEYLGRSLGLIGNFLMLFLLLGWVGLF